MRASRRVSLCLSDKANTGMIDPHMLAIIDQSLLIENTVTTVEAGSAISFLILNALQMGRSSFDFSD